MFQGGIYWLVLLDDYSASFGLMVVVITTCLAVTRVYGERGCGRWSQAPSCGRMGVYPGAPLHWVPGPKGQGFQWGQLGWRRG